jgi:hypothetical protein
MRTEHIPEFKIAARDPSRTINGVRFLHGQSAAAGLGHYMGPDLYRAFHKGRYRGEHQLSKHFLCEF